VAAREIHEQECECRMHVLLELTTPLPSSHPRSAPLIRRALQLTENLLKKPPFRFLHDIVSEAGAYTRPMFSST
jgi:hypothetical protein